MIHPFFDPVPGYLAHRDAYHAALDRVLRSGHLILGPETEAFESEVAAMHNVRHAVALASGTDAITLALATLNISVGDEVITVSHTAVATVAAIRRVGALPRFVDIAPQSLLMDETQITTLITSRTRAIVVVHLYGDACAMPAITAIARRYQLAVIEDCAQAFGTRLQQRHVGTFGDIACFSFYPTKTLGAFGDGGMCITQDSQHAQRLRMLRMYGFHPSDRHAHCEGFNSRLDELQAAFLRIKLKHFPAALKRRQYLAALYAEKLRGTLVTPLSINPTVEHSQHLYVVQSAQRPALIEHLSHAGIGHGIHYPQPVHLMEAYQSLGYKPGALPTTERAAQNVLSLPLYPEMSDVAICDIHECLREFSP